MRDSHLPTAKQTDYRGGINERDDPASIADNQLSDALNFYASAHGLIQRGGYAAVGDAFGTTGPLALDLLQRPDGLEYLVALVGGSLFARKLSATSWTTLTTALSTTVGALSCFGGYCYVVDGRGWLLRTDGVVVETIRPIQRPTAPSGTPVVTKTHVDDYASGDAGWTDRDVLVLTHDVQTDVLGTEEALRVWATGTHNSVWSAAFTGSGLNDMTTGGTWTGDQPRKLRVEIDGVASPNTFKWSKNGGATWKATGVAITGAAQALSPDGGGVTVTFGATTGHTATDRWDFGVGVQDCYVQRDMGKTSSITSNGAVRATNVVTLTTSAAHELVPGDKIVVSGVTDTTMNGTFSIATVPTTVTLTYASTGTNSNSGNGAVVGLTVDLSDVKELQFRVRPDSTYAWAFAFGISEDAITWYDYEFKAPKDWKLSQSFTDLTWDISQEVPIESRNAIRYLRVKITSNATLTEFVVDLEGALHFHVLPMIEILPVTLVYHVSPNLEYKYRLAFKGTDGLYSQPSPESAVVESPPHGVIRLTFAGAKDTTPIPTIRIDRTGGTNDKWRLVEEVTNTGATAITYDDKKSDSQLGDIQDDYQAVLGPGAKSLTEHKNRMWYVAPWVVGDANTNDTVGTIAATVAGVTLMTTPTVPGTSVAVEVPIAAVGTDCSWMCALQKYVSTTWTTQWSGTKTHAQVAVGWNLFAFTTSANDADAQVGAVASTWRVLVTVSNTTGAPTLRTSDGGALTGTLICYRHWLAHPSWAWFSYFAEPRLVALEGAIEETVTGDIGGYEPINPNRGGELVQISPLGSYLVARKKGSVGLLYISDDSQFLKEETLSSGPGQVGPLAATVDTDGKFLFWVSAAQDVWWIHESDLRPQIGSRLLTRLASGSTPTQWVLACHQERIYVFYGTGSTNNAVAVCDMRWPQPAADANEREQPGSWWVLSGWPDIRVAREFTASDGTLLFYGISQAGQLYRLDYGLTDAGNPITSSVEGKDYDMDAPMRQKAVASMLVAGDPGGEQVLLYCKGDSGRTMASFMSSFRNGSPRKWYAPLYCKGHTLRQGLTVTSSTGAQVHGQVMAWRVCR